MRLKARTLEDLQHIILRDYGVVVDDEEANQFGFSLLKVTRLAMGAFNQKEETSPTTDHLLT